MAVPCGLFEEYVAMGEGRSYGKLAQRHGLCKRTVVRRAKREGWQGRLLEIQRKAAERVETEAVESLATVNRRHLRVLKAVQAKALRALQQQPILNTGEAIRALLGALSQEREILGTPGSTGNVIIRVVTGVPRPEPGEILDADAEVGDVPAAGRLSLADGGDYGEEGIKGPDR